MNRTPFNKYIINVDSHHLKISGIRNIFPPDYSHKNVLITKIICECRYLSVYLLASSSAQAFLKIYLESIKNVSYKLIYTNTSSISKRRYPVLFFGHNKILMNYRNNFLEYYKIARSLKRTLERFCTFYSLNFFWFYPFCSLYSSVIEKPLP